MARIGILPAGRNTNVSGFTLMELLVVLTILGIALVLSAPALTRSLPSLELRTEAREAAGVLRGARALAIGHNQEVVVAIDREQRFLTVEGKPALQFSHRITIPFPAKEPHQPGSGITFEIRFFPDGTSSGGLLTLALGEREKHVAVDWLTGAVSIAD